MSTALELIQPVLDIEKITLDEYIMRSLRHERNLLLKETDWMSGSDVTMSDAWKKYRKDLRDLPSTAKPKLDENGQLTNVEWPTKPE